MPKITLKPHQLPPIRFIKDNFGLLLYHSTGSGKTITSLLAMDQFPKDVIIIGPKSSKKAFSDEIRKLGLDTGKFTIYTYTKIKTYLVKNSRMFQDRCLIVDEAHHLRSPTDSNIVLREALKESYKVLLLTATPIVNYLNDISVLINIVKKEDVLPMRRSLFNFFYFDERKMEIFNKDLLRGKLANCISYYESGENISNPDYPESTTIYLTKRMDIVQINEYKKYIKKIEI